MLTTRYATSRPLAAHQEQRATLPPRGRHPECLKRPPTPSPSAPRRPNPSWTPTHGALWSAAWLAGTSVRVEAPLPGPRRRAGAPAALTTAREAGGRGVRQGCLQARWYPKVWEKSPFRRRGRERVYTFSTMWQDNLVRVAHFVFDCFASLQTLGGGQ